MPLVLYCVAPEGAADTTVPGVGGAPVRSQVENGLRFFCSEAGSEAAPSDDLVNSAQAVHRVVSDIFSRIAVLPFRYPTIVADEPSLARLAIERGPAFRDFLRRVASKVQMDIRLTLSPDEVVAPTGSGAAYLKARAARQATLSAAAETCRLAADSAEWRFFARDENYRCQVLIERVEVVSFLERMRTLELPERVKAAVSGPWPPAGFWEDEPR